MSASVLALPFYFRQPATWSIVVLGNRRAGRRRMPSLVSSMVNSVPGPQERAARISLGRMSCPFVERRVVGIGKTSVRLSHKSASLWQLSRLHLGEAALSKGVTESGRLAIQLPGLF